MKLLVLASALLVFSTAHAGQLRFNRNGDPVCYSGNPGTALRELLNIDYDPALSHGKVYLGSRDRAPMLFALQIDENGFVAQRFVIPPCR